MGRRRGKNISFVKCIYIYIHIYIYIYIYIHIYIYNNKHPPKSVQNDLRNASSNFGPFFPDRGPPKTPKPQQSERFWGSAAGARSISGQGRMPRHGCVPPEGHSPSAKQKEGCHPLAVTPARFPPKSFTLLGFKRFWVSGVGKKDAKIPRCVSEVQFGHFLTIFCCFFCCLPSAKIRSFTMIPCLWHEKVLLATC